MLYIFWGEDDFSIEEALQEIKNTLGDASMLSTNTTVMEGQKLNLNEFKAVGEIHFQPTALGQSRTDARSISLLLFPARFEQFDHVGAKPLRQSVIIAAYVIGQVRHGAVLSVG